MPRVLQVAGFEIYIFTHDHIPPHVHVFRGGDEAIIVIENGDVRESYMSRRDLREARRIIEEHRGFLLQRWQEIGPVP